jgi:hypothetical protein
MTISEAKDIATLIGVIVAALSLVFTAINTRINARTNRARFWLDLRSQFSSHDDVHRRLRPGGSWADGKGPKESEEWACTEAYMGLFEHCEIMLSQGLIDEKTFREIYAYRLSNIVANDTIREGKLRDEASKWKLFSGLLKRMGVEMST